MTGPLPFGTTYFGANSCSTSTPSWLRGRSLTCPIEATTSYFRSRSFFTVLALVGDSTTTSDLPEDRLLGGDSTAADLPADCFLVGVGDSTTTGDLAMDCLLDNAARRVPGTPTAV